ncbi:MAG: LuxR family transcriptional regulator, regulator of acetate metabolism, partial [bacterium]
MATLLPRGGVQGRTPGYGHTGVAGPTGLAALRAALGRLRSVVDVHEMRERAVRELCVGLGFDRAVLFTVDDGFLVAEAAWFNGDSSWAAEFTAYARKLEMRPKLDHMLLES